MRWGACFGLLSVLRLTFIRFGIVALLGEVIYFILYGLVLKITDQTAISLALAGGFCILLNSYTHSQITFRVNFTWRLLFGYLQIQFLGFAIAFLLGLLLDKIGADKWVIALLTYAIWAAISFFLTKTLYQSERKKERLCSLRTKPRNHQS
jgi:hypothetical protein